MYVRAGVPDLSDTAFPGRLQRPPTSGAPGRGLRYNQTNPLYAVSASSTIPTDKLLAPGKRGVAPIQHSSTPDRRMFFSLGRVWMERLRCWWQAPRPTFGIAPRTAMLAAVGTAVAAAAGPASGRSVPGWSGRRRPLAVQRQSKRARLPRSRPPRAPKQRGLSVLLLVIWAAAAAIVFFQWLSSVGSVNSVPRSLFWHAVVAGMALLAHAFPVLVSREPRRITFLGPVACVGTVLIGPWAAGALVALTAAAVGVVDALVFRRSYWWLRLAESRPYVVATLPVGLVLTVAGAWPWLGAWSGVSATRALLVFAAATLVYAASLAVVRGAWRSPQQQRHRDGAAATLFFPRAEAAVFAAGAPLGVLLVLMAVEGGGGARRCDAWPCSWPFWRPARA
jgi:hypothetical protein